MRDRVAVSAWTSALGLAWLLLVTASTWYLGQRESVEYRCMLGRRGPAMADYNAARVSPEAAHPTGEFGWLPLGWTCHWDLAGTTFASPPEWSASIVAALGLLPVVTALALTWWPALRHAGHAGQNGQTSGT